MAAAATPLLAGTKNPQNARHDARVRAALESDAGIERLNRLRGEIDETREVLVDGIGRVLERGEKIEDVVDRTDRLVESTVQFVRGTRRVRKAMWWNKYKPVMLGVLGVALVVGIVLLVVLV